MLNEELEKLDELKGPKLIQEIQKVGKIVQNLATTTGVEEFRYVQMERFLQDLFGFRS
jgi:hypothetical protein